MSHIKLYSAEEMELLQQLILKYPVVKVKKNDATNIRRRAEGWLYISYEYNRCSGVSKVCFVLITYFNFIVCLFY